MTLLRTSILFTVLAGGAWSLGWTPGSGGPASPETRQVASDEQGFWFAPAHEGVDEPAIEQALALMASERPAEAVPLLESVQPDETLAPYVELHRARAYLAVKRPSDAASAARTILATSPAGHLGESALQVLGAALEETGDWSEAVRVWDTLAGLSNAASVQLRLAQAAEKAGDRGRARAAYSRVFYEWPETPEAGDAETALARFPLPSPEETVDRELARAERLYDARRFSDAYEAYARVRARTSGGDRQLVDRRLAQCDIQLGRYARGLRALEEYLSRADAIDREEAGLFVLTAARGSTRADYPARVARFVAAHPASPFAEAAMNDLATHYILADQDGRAADVFADMYARWPDGRFADRAAWRAGWWAYRADDFRRTIHFFESAATTMRRADYRPAWLYWTARSYAAIGQHDTARLWLVRAMADYRNSYYGRLAAGAYQSLTGSPPSAGEVLAERDPSRALAMSQPPASAPLIRRLLQSGLYDDAIAELRRLQAAAGSPSVEATLAYALNRKGELRPAITAMRRAYPQFMSDGGEALPRRVLEVIFPVAHAETLRRYASERSIDPHLLTALVAQESTFQADVVSSANAVGLMQLLPATARRYAGRAGVTGFEPRMLTEPATNVRLGTTYLADLLGRYAGDAAPALAAYNAGEHRVDRWRKERPGVPRDEFIDDIPFPETQNYVKRILGTAEDYRILYPSIDAIASRTP